MNDIIIKDIIIVGGGIVGLTFANLCLDLGFNIVLVTDKEPVLSEIDGLNFSLRTSAINYASEKIFNKINCFSKFDRISSYEKMIVWDEKGFGEITFSCDEVNRDNLGYIIENQVMLKALWERILAFKDNCKNNFNNDTCNNDLTSNNDLKGKIEIVIQKPVAIKKTDSAISLQFEDKSIINARLLVGADGAHSFVRTNSNIKTASKPYEHTAIIANVKTKDPHQSIARQRFLSTGPLAFLPLGDPNTSSIVWSTHPNEAKTLLALSDEEFCDALTKAFEGRLGLVLSVSKRESFPLSRMHAKQYFCERTALIGDALHVIHPLGGQGVNLGIQDADALASVLSSVDRKEIGQSFVLAQYEKARKKHNLTMMWGLDFFKHLFQTQNSGLILLRSLGVNLTDKFSYLKRQLMQVAIGSEL